MRIEQGQVAVVTGGASGIGFALGAALSSRGITVVLADIEAQALAAAEKRMELTSTVSTAVCDVSDAGSVKALRQTVLERHGRVDWVFNNAGVVLPFKPMWEHTQTDWEWIMGVNLWGVINGIREFVPGFVQQGTGHIVNTASMAGVAVVPFNGAYNATKHAVVSLTETLAVELAQTAPGVRASVICPGLVPTQIGQAARNRPGGQQPEPPEPSEAASNVVDDNSHANVITAELLAARVLNALEVDRLYIFPNPGSAAPVEERLDRLRQDLTTSSLEAARV